MPNDFAMDPRIGYCKSFISGNSAPIKDFASNDTSTLPTERFAEQMGDCNQTNQNQRRTRQPDFQHDYALDAWIIVCLAQSPDYYDGEVRRKLMKRQTQLVQFCRTGNEADVPSFVIILIRCDQVGQTDIGQETRRDERLRVASGRSSHLKLTAFSCLLEYNREPQ
jgi:hypothetical protein